MNTLTSTTNTDKSAPAIEPLAHFPDLQSLSNEQFWGLMHLAMRLKKELANKGANEPLLKDKSLAMVFTKPSLRTRVSFQRGMEQLGGSAIYLSPQEVGLGSRESAPDVARVLAGYCHGIMARVFEHRHILEMIEWGSVPVINGLSDYSHPCQALTDLFTVWEHVGEPEGLVMAYVGDGSNNVATSLMQAAGKCNMPIRIISPAGYLPDPKEIEQIDADITVTSDLAAVEGVDVLYTDVWTSMGQEAEKEARMAVFPPYQINAALLKRTGKETTKVMHCLPAHRGEEITDDVADGSASLLFPQAHNRLHAQKAILAHLLGGIPLE